MCPGVTTLLILKIGEFFQFIGTFLLIRCAFLVYSGLTYLKNQIIRNRTLRLQKNHSITIGSRNSHPLQLLDKIEKLKYEEDQTRISHNHWKKHWPYPKCHGKMIPQSENTIWKQQKEMIFIGNDKLIISIISKDIYKLSKGIHQTTITISNHGVNQ